MLEHNKKLTKRLYALASFSLCMFYSGSVFSVEMGPRVLDLSKLKQKGSFSSSKHSLKSKKSLAKALHIKTKINSVVDGASYGFAKKKPQPTALTQNQVQFGTKLSRQTSLYVTASFKNVRQRYKSREWAHKEMAEKSFIMPGIGFEWRPPEKIELGKYKWRMPHKLSLSGELRADILNKEEPLGSLKDLPSKLRFNAVLLKVHYRFGARK